MQSIVVNERVVFHEVESLSFRVNVTSTGSSEKVPTLVSFPWIDIVVLVEVKMS